MFHHSGRLQNPQNLKFFVEEFQSTIKLHGLTLMRGKPMKDAEVLKTPKLKKIES